MREHKIQTDIIGKSPYYKSQVTGNERRDKGIGRRSGAEEGHWEEQAEGNRTRGGSRLEILE